MLGLIFTFLLTYGGSLVALFRPYVGLLIFVCFAILKPDSLWHWSVPEGNYSRIVAIALLLGWMLRGFGSWHFGRARIIVLSAIGFVICCAISSLSANSPEAAWAFTETLGKNVLAIVVGATLINTVTQLKQLAWVIALCQGFLALEFNLSYYEGFNRLARVGFAGMDDKSVAVGMVAASAVALFLTFDAKTWLAKILALGLMGLMIHVPLLTFSRGGILGLIAVAMVTFLLLPKRPVHYLVFALVVIAGLRLAGPEVRKHFQTTFRSAEERDESAQTRLDLWEKCWDTMLSHPMMGIGPRNWGAWVKNQYNWPTGQEAHQTWLQAGAELGFPGLLALVVFYGYCMCRLWPHRNAPESANLARMVIAGLAGFVVSSQFITLYGIDMPYFLALIGIGVIKIGSCAPLDSRLEMARPVATTQQAASRISYRPKAVV